MIYKALALTIALLVFLLNQWVSGAVVAGQLSFANGFLSTELSYHGIFAVILPVAMDLFMRQMLLVSLILIVALFLLISTLRYSDNINRALVFGGLLGGVISNLAYRYQHGYLLNTFKIQLLNLQINFNVADVAICLAILYFVIDLVVMNRQRARLKF